MSSDQCVVCKDDWKERKNTPYNTGAKSIPMLFGMQLKSGSDRVRLVFCDKHGNNHMAYTKLVKGILKIRNIRTGKWNFAKRLGDVV